MNHGRRVSPERRFDSFRDMNHNSLWAEENWDGDGDFTSRDLVKVLSEVTITRMPNRSVMRGPDPRVFGIPKRLKAIKLSSHAAGQTTFFEFCVSFI